MRFALAAAALLFAASASADQQKVFRSLDVIDFIVDGRSLYGKRVTVTGCRITGASKSMVNCDGPGTSGHFYVEAVTLDREALRRSLRLCADFVDKPTCHADVTGLVAEAPGHEPGLKDATIRWAQP